MLHEMMAGWDADSDGTVSKAEFIEFYSYASAAVERDDSFVRVMKSAWRL